RLDDTNEHIRAFASMALFQLANLTNVPPEGIEKLTRQARDTNLIARQFAVAMLGKVARSGKEHPELVPLLFDSLNDTNDEVFGISVKMLGEIADNGVTLGRVVSQLLSWCESRDASIRRKSAFGFRVLGETATTNTRVIPALRVLLDDQ